MILLRIVLCMKELKVKKILIKEIINLRKKLFTDSEDSDEEGGLGNVNRLIIRPAGHSGKAKKGKN